jgi:uncharacterized iron-regulated membrane protein
MSTKKVFRKLHLWLGLPSAIVLFVVCFSGSLFAFADPMMDFFSRNMAYVEAQQTPKLPTEHLIMAVKQKYPAYNLTNFVAYKDNDKAVKFLLFSKEKGLMHVFANPYTGELTGQSKCIYFFFIVAHFHSQLLLGPAGQWIVKVATIVFLILLISGTILWYPAKWDKTSLRSFFTIKREPYKRTIFDQHRVLGIYSLAMLLLLGTTGLIMAFEPLSRAVSKMAGADPDTNLITKADTSLKALPLSVTVNKLLDKPSVGAVQIKLFGLSRFDVFPAITGTSAGILTYHGNIHYINKYTAEEIKAPKVNRNMSVQNMLMRLHIGDWGGWLGRLFTFFAGLAGAHISLTGILLWWNKRH